MAETTYDEVCRYLGQKAERQKLMSWLLGVSEQDIPCDALGDCNLVIPKLPERICDLVALMRDQTQGGLPCAGIVEFELTPDPLMPGRLMVAGGMLWLRLKPTDLVGDRFGLIGVVVNLTGKRDSSHSTILQVAERKPKPPESNPEPPKADQPQSTLITVAEWIIKPRELNLEEFDANAVMDDIEADKAPIELMALIPLMKMGDDPDTLKRWHAIVSALTDQSVRGDCVLAVVFAGAVGRRGIWQTLVEGLAVIESPVVADWKRQSRDKGISEGILKGKIEGKVETLLRILRRQGAIPDELSKAINACTDNAQLDSWIDTALDSASIDDFRARAKL